MDSMSYNRNLEILGSYDVVVAGSGPSGICAAVAAARQGAKTAIIERYGIVGGNLTSGCVGPIMGSVSAGTMRDELTARLNVNGNDMLGFSGYVHDIEQTKRTLVNFLNEEGVKLYLQTPVTDAIVNNSCVAGIVVGTKKGPAAIVGRTFVDATGDGDVAYYAGASYDEGRADDRRVQPVTLMYVLGGVDDSRAIVCVGEADPVDFNGEPFPMFTQRCCEQGLLPANTAAVRLYRTLVAGERLVNTTQVNDVFVDRPEDVERAENLLRQQIAEITEFLRARVPGYENCYVKHSATTLGVRESRRYLGTETLTGKDVQSGRKSPDVVVHNANFCIDIHNPVGSGQAESFDLVFSNQPYDIPYGCLVPKDIDGMLLTGRCISGTHHAHASYRVMSICMALGEAAGIAAALCALSNTRPRDLRPEIVQRKLLNKGVILFEHVQ